MSELKKKPLFNPGGDTDIRLRRMIGGNTTNLNDFNNLRYTWVNDWYRQAMNNFWIPEEINLSQDMKDYPKLSGAERKAYEQFLDTGGNQPFPGQKRLSGTFQKRAAGL